jgi:2-keto-3-deoxy-L-rhamnonate aldolase RhmA
LRYPPEGSRGIAKMIRASGYGSSSTGYMKTANENILGIAQIESAEALDNLDAIAEVDGIDVLFIGPSDLTAALGIFGQFDHPLYKDALKATINAAQKAGKATGILLLKPEEYGTYYSLGIRVMACGSDAGFVAEGAKTVGARMMEIKKGLPF